jgi:hypothetical protein
MVYGELGRMPLHHQWYKHLLRFWNQLLGTSNETATDSIDREFKDDPRSPPIRM